jgi:hypothetical protein
MPQQITEKTATDAWLSATHPHHVILTVTDPFQRLVFAHPIDPAYALVKTAWTLSGFNSLEFLEFWNPSLSEFSADGVILQGACGYRLGSKPAHINEIDHLYRLKAKTEGIHDQLRVAYNTLKESQHAVLQVWQAENDLTPSKDTPHNLISRLSIHDGKLYWIQDTLSVDRITELPYDFVQWMMIQEIVAGWLGLEVGDYTQIIVHLTPNEVEPYATIVPTCTSDLRIEGYEAWQMIFAIYVDALDMMRIARNGEDILSILRTTKALLSSGYYECLTVIGAEACRRKGYLHTGLRLSESLSDYYRASWTEWFNHVQSKS